jgi:NADH:ubiquinone oxidoreductase subunit C
MNREELQAYIGDLGAGLTFEEGGDWINVFVEPAAFRELMLKLRADEKLAFDYLFCLTCVDWKTHLTMVYHLSSTRYRYNIVVKSKLDRTTPEIETICDIWRTAEFHEREVYELFGVTFLNHPDLRLLILPDGWEGKNPMRKDYEDEVNMIKL